MGCWRQAGVVAPGRGQSRPRPKGSGGIGSASSLWGVNWESIGSQLATVNAMRSGSLKASDDYEGRDDRHTETGFLRDELCR